MKKLFAGIYNVNFDEENKHIISMNSIEGESVPLKNKVRISNEVEHWLNELAKEMKGMVFFPNYLYNFVVFIPIHMNVRNQNLLINDGLIR